MRGVRGRFVCSKNHMASDRHPRHEVSAATNKLKEEHPETLITVEDLDSIYHTDDGIEDEPAAGTKDSVRWVYEDSEDSDLSYCTYQQGIGIEASLTQTSFLHGHQKTPSKKYRK